MSITVLGTFFSFFISKNCYLLDFIPADIAMLFAVSILSPVSIQIWMPAFLSVSIVLNTSSYNLSSTPVTPKYSIFHSMLSIASYINYSLLLNDALALLYL